MKYRVIVHKRAATYLQRLPVSQKERLKEAIRQLEENPLNLPQIKLMVGEWAGYRRLRVGDWRIIYWVDENNQTVYVDYIGSRGDIYKKSS
jgi:mRNA interferase RelE/StbE